MSERQKLVEARTPSSTGAAHRVNPVLDPSEHMFDTGLDVSCTIPGAVPGCAARREPASQRHLGWARPQS